MVAARHRPRWAHAPRGGVDQGTVNLVAVTYYEVWDDLTGNRAGGSYDTLEEARALLTDILRVNGPAAVSEMAILAFAPTSDGRYEPTTVLEGTDLVTQAEVSSSPSGV